MNSTQIRCALYDRVSSELQVKFGLSLDTQKALLTEYANTHGYEIVDCYIDEGITARKKLENRKEFMRLMSDIKKDKIDIVLVTKLDRWFRNVKDYHNTQAVLEAHHCNWKTILEDYDTSTADGQLKINIMLAVAQNESDRTSERIKVVFDYKKRKGEHLTGKAPYGYQTVNKMLEKDPGAQHIVENIYIKYFRCLSKRETINYIFDKYADDPNAPTPYQINRILSHEVYAGMRYGVTGYCQPYISPEQYQKLRTICSSKTYPSTKEPYLFSQLMRCPHCNAVMTGFIKRQKLKNGETSQYKRYRCSAKYAKHPPGACVSESVAEEYMLKNVSPELHYTLYKIQSIANTSERKNDSTKIKAEINRLNLLYQKGRLEENYYEQQYKQLENRRKAEQERNRIMSVEDFTPTRQQLCNGWNGLYRKLDPEHKKVFWKRIIKEIYIDPKTHKICGFDFLI